MSIIGDHLRVPLGLAMDKHIRDFILTLDKDEDRREEIADIPVAPDSIQDWMYETLVLKPQTQRGKFSLNKTHKNRNKS
jgi:hypothetical protein